MRAFLKCRRLGLLLPALILTLTACRSTQTSSAPTDPTGEPSVNPGINDAFLQPDLDIHQWIGRFEIESREVFRLRESIVAELNIQPGSEIADIGAGTGLFVPYFSKATGAEGLVYAVDIAPDFILHIDEKVAEAGLNNVISVLCTEDAVELPDNSIDLAFICDVYHHFEYPHSSMTSLHKALRPGGEVVLVDFKRIPGESSEWTLNHVRAGQDVFTAEIEKAGFEKIGEHPILEENYMVRFKKRVP
jgi:SAM-dependent methyltransferase